MFDLQNLPLSGGLVLAVAGYAAISFFVTGPLVGERTIAKSDWAETCPAALNAEILSQAEPAPMTPRFDCNAILGWMGRDFQRVCAEHGNPEFKLPFQDQVQAQERALYEAKQRRLEMRAAQSGSRCACAASLALENRTAWALLRKRKTFGTVVIIDDISRLARGIDAHLKLRTDLSAAGGKLESPSIEFGEDSDSILVENLLASVSQHQRQKNGEQTVNRMRARCLNGYWCFQAPMGYEYKRASGHGNMLVRVEPVASYLQEALEGFASGRFETQVEVKRFLEGFPDFPKDTNTGLIHNQRIADILTRPVYAGYIAVPNWNVSLRKAQHEGLISFETFQKIQNRLSTGAKAPARKSVPSDIGSPGRAAN